MYPLDLSSNRKKEVFIATHYCSLKRITVKVLIHIALSAFCLEATTNSHHALGIMYLVSTGSATCSDEWKPVFSSTSAQHKYLVMPYGLVSAPIVSRMFVNDPFRDKFWANLARSFSSSFNMQRVGVKIEKGTMATENSA